MNNFEIRSAENHAAPQEHLWFAKMPISDEQAFLMLRILNDLAYASIPAEEVYNHASDAEFRIIAGELMVHHAVVLNPHHSVVGNAFDDILGEELAWMFHLLRSRLERGELKEGIVTL